MAVIKTLQSNNLITILRSCLVQNVPSGSRICIGLSGGIDSVVLLHVFSQLKCELSLSLSAIHIHHGLSSNADSWAATCVSLCDALAVPLQIHKVQIMRNAKSGLEAAARDARYSRFQQLEADFIALAHHRDDQAETVLLQLLRGAGVKGLAAMAVLHHQGDHPSYLRPFLHTDRNVIQDWAVRHQLNWVEDESNHDTHFARNFLRHNVLPLLSQPYPAWRATIARSAEHMAEAALLLDELAIQDAQTGLNQGRIDCEHLATLSAARGRNLLRYFFAQHHCVMPNQNRLAEMLNQLIYAGYDNQLAVYHDGMTLHRYRRYGYLVPTTPMPAANTRWHWNGEESLFLAELGGSLQFRSTLSAGLDPNRLANVQIRLRQGGEIFRPHCNRPERKLKTLLQTAEIPFWERSRIPLIYSGDSLVAVPGIGYACGSQAIAGTPAINITWSPQQQLSP